MDKIDNIFNKLDLIQAKFNFRLLVDNFWEKKKRKYKRRYKLDYYSNKDKKIYNLKVFDNLDDVEIYVNTLYGIGMGTKINEENIENLIKYIDILLK